MTKVHRQHHNHQILTTNPNNYALNDSSGIMEKKKKKSWLWKICLPYTTGGRFKCSIGTIIFLKFKQSSITCGNKTPYNCSEDTHISWPFFTALVLTWMCSSLTSGCVHGDVHQYSKDEIPVSADFYTEKTQDLNIILFCLI